MPCPLGASALSYSQACCTVLHMSIAAQWGLGLQAPIAPSTPLFHVRAFIAFGCAKSCTQRQGLCQDQTLPCWMSIVTLHPELRPGLHRAPGSVTGAEVAAAACGSWLPPSSLLCLGPSSWSCCCWDAVQQAGQVSKHTSILPQLPLRVLPVNMSLSDGKVNKFSSRLKVLIISFVSDK